MGILEVVSTSTTVKVPKSQRGTKPIDVIYFSHSLAHKHTGYFPFGVFQSNHRALWIDVEYTYIFGFKLPTQQPTNFC